MMPVRRDPLDALFSDLVRERVNYVCEACGRYFPPGERQGLHCSHHISRRYNATRWNPLNAAAHGLKDARVVPVVVETRIAA